MEITIDQARKIAQLSRLTLDEAELAQLQGNLGDILGYVEMLNELDLDGVAETAHPFMEQMRTRPDQAEPFADTDAIIQNGPATRDRLFQVPRIIADNS